MKAKIHPKYGECTVRCTCGNEFTTRSTANDGELKVSICSACHPFYTGQQRYVDTAGRIEKFQKRFKMSDGQKTDEIITTKKAKRKKQIDAEARREERAAKAARKMARADRDEKAAEKDKGESAPADKASVSSDKK